jgi:ABC-type sulfate transport system substrate-binding protein
VTAVVQVITPNFKTCGGARWNDLAAKFVDKLPALQLVTIDADFGGWEKAQKVHFDDGGTFDKIFSAK